VRCRCYPSQPDRLRVVGVGRAPAPQVRRARAPAGRAPISRSRSRSFAGRERNTVPEDGAPRAESEGRVFPVPDRPAVGENRLLWYNTGLLHPKLPSGFNSWTQVLTDWAVSRVWLAVKAPPCLKGRPELAAPFVAEVGAAIRLRQLQRWPSQVELEQAKVTEPAYDQAGGSAYRALRTEMDSVLNDYLSVWRVQRFGDTRAVAVFEELRARKERLDAAFAATRSRNTPMVNEARKLAAKTYWTAHDRRVLADTCFADEPSHTVIARMARIHPPWWGAFHGRLQKIFAHGHPAEGCLLDALPALRCEADKRSKLTMEATVAGWWLDRQDHWGWYADKEPHYRMITERARTKKTPELIDWFDSTAPGYLADQTVRVSLHAALTERLCEADPWSVPAPDGRSMLAWSEHGMN
jgi:hypothetical protein